MASPEGFEDWLDFNDFLDRDSLSDEAQYFYADQTYENAAVLYIELGFADIHHLSEIQLERDVELDYSIDPDF